MPRKARQKSESGIYHIIMRGINRQFIFEDEEDHLRFLQTILQYKEVSEFELYAYCLMGNHIHLLIKIGKEPLEKVMRRICGSYVYWYNKKYQRIGNLFQDRFKSEAVETDAYFLTVLRYIHQNPIKAKLVSLIEEYKWSSYNEYIRETKAVDVNFALNILDHDRKKAKKRFIQNNKEINEDVCLEMEENYPITDEEAKAIIKEVCEINNTMDIQKFDIITRNRVLKKLKEENNLSIRQIERITGVNRGIVHKA